MRHKAFRVRIPHVSVCLITARLATLLICFSVISAVVHAAPPITPSGLNTQVNLSATPPPGKTQYDITGGTRPGGGANLFHSFGDFNVPNNNIANFLNDSGIPTSNILGRVTGGNLSSIFGTIQTTGFGNANLFLMNPAGFLFGPNATVNVGGMVAFTSADYLRLADGVRFNAVPDAAADALLSTAPVAAYGFLGSNPGVITVQGSQFTVTEGTGIALIGGNISIESATPDGGIPQSARLLAPNGKIQLASAASPGEFDAATLQSLPNIDGASFTSFGAVSLAPGSNINISGTNKVSIQGGQFVLSVTDTLLSTAASTGPAETILLRPTSSIISSNAGPEPGADIQILGDNIQMSGATIQSLATGDGPGGNLSIIGHTVSLTDGTQILTSTSGNGNGGNITLSGTESVSVSGYDTTGTLSGVTTFVFDPNTGVPLVTSGIFSTTSATGNGGQIAVSAPTIAVSNGGTIATVNTGDGRGGDVLLNGQSVSITDGGQLSSFTGLDFSTFGSIGTGQGGNLIVNGTGSILLSGSSAELFSFSSIQSITYGGTGGNVHLSAPNVMVHEGAQIISDAEGPGRGGDINISAPNQLSLTGLDPSGTASTISSFTGATFLDGQGGAINITAGSVNMSDQASIASHSLSGSGKPGDLTFQVQGTLSVTGQAQILSDSIGTAPSSGNINITADKVLISGGDPQFPSRIENINGGGGTTGNISIHARELLLSDNARINNEGPQGQESIIISATESVKISDRAAVRVSNTLAEPHPGGLLEITAPSIILDQGIIQTLASGGGDASAVNLQAGNLSLFGSRINSNTQQVSQGGDVTIHVTDKLAIAGQFAGDFFNPAGPGGIFTTTSQQAGDAGRVSITAGTIEMSGGNKISSSSSSPGAAGAINIVAGNIVLSGLGTGLFSESTNTGSGGAINVQTPQFQLTNGAIISAKSTGPGTAGSVTIQGMASPAQSVLIDGAGSGVFTDTSGTGAGGNIFVNANSVMLQNGGTLSAATSGTSPSATGGTITVNASQVQLAGGLITASTTGSGAGGSITIDAGSTFSSNAGTVSTTATQAGGGDINLTAGGSVTLDNGSLITASSNGAGNAGNILINAGQSYTSTNSSVTTKADQASGGNITVLATGMVHLTNSEINASVEGSQTTVGGNILIDPVYVILQNSRILARATQGTGGNINIFYTGALLADPSSIIDASSQFGQSGTITIQSPNAPASGKIVPLGKSPLLSTSLFNQRCAALAGGTFSSFTVTGRDTLPSEPGSWLSSPRALGTTSEPNPPQVNDEPQFPLLSLRQVGPSGFLTQSFALESSGCQS